ncbi:MAG: trifunctional serine/threonine-protein kinase/ATP-binding protein/sensor histidine kinase [Acidobacteriota bacterium]|nr:trifunctional serine/threonine-protein kinase/ATP-binding protein/sensor histidine kinase [Acidobacteriota bacterium]
MIHLPGYRCSEKLHESEKSLVYRCDRLEDGLSVVLKLSKMSPLDRKEDHTLEQYRREHALGTAFHDDHVIDYHALEYYEVGPVLVVEDFGAVALTHLIPESGFAVKPFLELAIQLAGGLEAIHRRHIVHKDIKPANIVINPETRQAKIIDFGISSQLSREMQTGGNPAVLEGSLAYISPEQTGRMNRAMDYRTDLYSLGITLFELLTGSRPFDATDPLELIHCHIARRPPSPADLNPSVPTVLCEIVLRLLAKNAEARYQSARGLQADLERCLLAWEETGEIAPFPPALRDVSDKFQIPQKLYGREREIEMLLRCFDRVSEGGVELLLVIGHAGVGKSSLVNEIRKPVTSRRGYFIAGKFDQLGRNQAYSAISTAFRALIAQVLGESEASIQAWRTALREALGDNARVIFDLVPDLEFLVGSPPAVPELSPDLAENRFKLVFSDFLRVCAGPAHPVALFLDDLQWADPPSLRLIELLLSDKQIDHFLLIGAFRDNEVEGDHLLSLTLNRLRKTEVEQRTVHLEPLAEQDLRSLVADTLRCPEETGAPLAEVLRDKTSSNPFFTGELLNDLHRRGLLRFLPGAGRWDWDLQQIREVAVSDNVVIYTIESLRRLPAETRDALSQAACFGNRFSLGELSRVLNQPPPRIARHLWPALRNEVILPLAETYRLVTLQNEDKGEVSDLGVHYRFRHDRVQQAAYALIPDEDKPAAHLRVGRAIEAAVDEEERGERLGDIADHLNKGRALLKTRAELDRLAQLNLEVGIRAKAAIAYQSAHTYLAAGLACLGENPWAADGPHETAFALYRHYAEACFFIGAREEAEAAAEISVAHAPGNLAKTRIHAMQMGWHTVGGRNDEAIRLGKQALRLLGIRLGEPKLPALLEAIAKVLARLRFRKPEKLLSLPEVDDPRIVMAMRLLTHVSTAYFLSGMGKHWLLTSLVRVRLAIEHGNCPESAFAYFTFGLPLSARLGCLRAGNDFGNLALKLIARYPTSYLQTRLYVGYGMTIIPWNRHWKEIRLYLDKAVETGLQFGDFFYAGSGCAQSVHWDPTLSLAGGVEEYARYQTILDKLGSRELEDMAIVLVQYRRALLGRTESPTSLSDEQIDENAILERAVTARFAPGLATYHTIKAILAFMDEAYGEAAVHVDETRGLASAFLGTPFVAEICFFSFLIQAARFSDLKGVERKRARDQMRRDLKRMRAWAAHCPVNFEHRRLLMKAEKARLEGRAEKANYLYGEAADAAGRDGYTREEALANELAVRFQTQRGRHRPARTYLSAALEAYHRWGAKTRVQALRKQLATGSSPSPQNQEAMRTASPEPAVQTTRTIRSTLTTTTHGEGTTTQSLDLSTVIKSSRAISSEIDYESLIAKMMGIIIECAGAQSGALLIAGEEGPCRVEAHVEGDRAEIMTTVPDPVRQAAASGMVRYVFRTGRHLVLEDAARTGLFCDDTYVAQHQPKSVLCMPIRTKDQVFGALYLENNLITDAFKEDRIALLDLLVSQAAISLENARLFSETRTAERQVRRLNEELEERVRDRTAELEKTQRDLVDKAHQAGMAQIATSVLHNVGNLLNSVITSAQLIESTASSSRTLQGIRNANLLLSDHIHDPVTFFRDDPKGMDLLRYYLRLDPHAAAEKELLIRNAQRLTEKINSIRQVIMEQQRLAAGGLQAEMLSLQGIVEDVLGILAGTLERHQVKIETRFAPAPEILLHKNKLLHVIINLLENAKEAVVHLPPDERHILISIGVQDDAVFFEVRDNGIGITHADMPRIYQYGFTTKQEGHGFGLHASANAVNEMGGTISAESEGKGLGAAFRLCFPITTVSPSPPTAPVCSSAWKLKTP